MSTVISLWRDTWGWAGLIAVAVTALAVARLIAEDRRLARRRRENAARQAVIDDALPQVFAHVPYGTLSAEAEQWLRERGHG